MLMGIVMGLLLTVEVFTSLLLVVAILIQRTRSQGMGLAFGAGVGETMFGSQAGNVLTRATVILSIIFLVNTTVLALIGTTRRERSVVETIGTTPALPTAPMAPAGAPAPGPMSLSPDAGGFGAIPASPEFAETAPVLDVAPAGDLPAASLELPVEAAAPAPVVIPPVEASPLPAAEPAPAEAPAEAPAAN